MNHTPFFGSKISLISKSEIRYEGILYTVDPKESTIALAQVRSFGSEDRIVDKPVPPRDEIYQYIIFRASDIKDLIVDQPPSPALTDPAIIQAHTTTSPPNQSTGGSQSAAFPSSFPQSSSINSGGNASASIQQQLQQAGIPNALAAVAAGSASSLAPGSSKTSSGQQQPQQSSASSNEQASKPKLSSAQVVASGNSQAKQGQQQANKQQQQMPQRNNANQMNRQQQPHNQHQHQGGGRNQHQDGGTGGTGGSFGGNRFNGFVRRVNNNPRMNGFNQRNGQQNFNRNFSNRFQPRPQSGFNSYNRRQNNRNFVTRQNAKPTITLPDSDFDFEKAQDEFLQLEEKMANMKVNGEVSTGGDGNGEVSTNAQTVSALSSSNTTTKSDGEPPKDCYNKEKSFFDKISCEALEREKGNVQRVDWKAERKLNRETFGVVLPLRRNGYRPVTNRFGNSGGGSGGYRSFSNYRNRGQVNSSGGSSNKANGVTNSVTSTSGPSTSTAASVVAASSSSQIVSPAKN